MTLPYGVHPPPLAKTAVIGAIACAENEGQVFVELGALVATAREAAVQLRGLRVVERELRLLRIGLRRGRGEAARARFRAFLPEGETRGAWRLAGRTDAALRVLSADVDATLEREIGELARVFPEVVKGKGQSDPEDDLRELVIHVLAALGFEKQRVAQTTRGLFPGHFKRYDGGRERYGEYATKIVGRKMATRAALLPALRWALEWIDSARATPPLWPAAFILPQQEQRDAARARVKLAIARCEAVDQRMATLAARRRRPREHLVTEK